jgi:hypothetical protein
MSASNQPERSENVPETIIEFCIEDDEGKKHHGTMSKEWWESLRRDEPVVKRPWWKLWS